MYLYNMFFMLFIDIYTCLHATLTYKIKIKTKSDLINNSCVFN